MALVRASQLFVLEGFAEFEERKHFWSRSEFVRAKTKTMLWVDVICDEADAPTIIEEELQRKMKEYPGRGRNFEGWTSYRKYLKPGELSDYPNGKVEELKLDYIRNWKMEKIIKELDGNQFAVLCKELGITAGEAILKQ